MDKYLSYKIKFVSFVCTIFVVFIHSANSSLISCCTNSSADIQGSQAAAFLQDFISLGICRVAVPIFFTISGYLFFYNFEGTVSSYLKKYKSRIRTLVIPYLFWSLFSVALYAILQDIPAIRNLFSGKLLSSYTNLDWLRTILVDPLAYQLWFLRDLILLVILSPAIFIATNVLGRFFLIFILLAWFGNFNWLVFSGESLFFFSCGAFLSIRKLNINIVQTGNLTALIGFCWLMLLLFQSAAPLFNMELPSIQKLSVMFGCTFIWISFDTVYTTVNLQKNAIKNILSYSFFIYVFHIPMLTFIKKGYIKVVGEGELKSIIIYFASAFSIILLSLIVGKLLNKLFPKLFATITGGR